MEQMSDLFVEHCDFKFQDETQIFFILQQLNIEKSRFRKHSWLQLAYKLLFPSIASYYLHDRSLLMSWHNIIFTFFSNLFKLTGT